MMMQIIKYDSVRKPLIKIEATKEDEDSFHLYITHGDGTLTSLSMSKDETLELMNALEDAVGGNNNEHL